MKSIVITILLLTLAAVASAQNSIKLFDAVPVGASDYNVLMNSVPYGVFKSAHVYLSCPSSPKASATLSGPNGGELVVDNFLTLNGTNVCRGNCFSFSANPAVYIGMPVEMAYGGVAPINVGREITGTGLYTFDLLDFGQLYGSSAIYLNTSCSIIPIDTPPTDQVPTPPVTPVPGGNVICHRNNGNNGSVTLTVGAPAVAPHLAHGDTLGACSQ